MLGSREEAIEGRMLRHAARYFIGQTTARGSVHLYSLLLAKLLSNEGFVAFTFFLIGANVFARVANYSLNMAMVKFRFVDSNSSNGLDQDRLYRFATTFGLSLTIFCLIVTSSSELASLIGFTKNQLSLILISGFFLSVENNQIEFWQSHFQSQRYLAYMLSFTALLSCLPLSHFFGFRFESATVPMTAYCGAQAVVLLASRSFRLGWSFTRQEVWTILSMGLAFVVYALSSFGARYFELILLRGRIPVDEMAAFSFAFRVMEALFLVMLACYSALNPYLFGILKSGSASKDQTRRISMLIGIEILFFAIYSALVPSGIKIWMPEFGRAVFTIPFFYLVVSLTTWAGLIQSMLVYYGRYYAITAWTCFGLGIGILGSLTTLPVYGVRGALWSKVLAMIVTLGGYLWSCRGYPIQIRELGLAKVAFLNAILFLALYVGLASFS